MGSVALIVIAVVLVSLVAAYFRPHSREETEILGRASKDLNEQFEELSKLGADGLTLERFTEIWIAICAALEIPPDKLYMADRFDDELLWLKRASESDRLFDLQDFIKARIKIAENDSHRPKFQTVGDVVMAVSRVI